MSSDSKLGEYPIYNQYSNKQLPPRKRKKQKNDGERLWLGLGCLGSTTVIFSLLVASLIFGLAENPEPTTIALVQEEPSATPTLTIAPSLTLTFTPTPTFTPQGLFLTTSPVVSNEIPTLAPQLTPVPLDNRLIDIIWLNNGREVVVASSQNIWLIDITEESPPQKITTTLNVIRDIALNHNSQWLAVAYETGYVELIGMETLLNVEDVTAGQTILTIEFSPTEDILAMALEDGTISFWSVPEFAEISHLDGNLTVFSLAYRADGQQLAVGGINSQVDLWDIASGQTSTTLNADHVGWVIALDYAPNGQWVASSGEGGAIFVTDSTTGERLYTLPAQANVLQFSPDSTRLASGSEDSLLRIWDFANGEQFAEFDYRAPITSLAFRPDGAWIAVGGLAETLSIWEISSGNLVYEWILD